MSILFFDIDGTLTDRNTGEVADSTREAIAYARNKGHLCFINSGRPYSTIDQSFIDMMDGVVCQLGTYIECKGEEILYHPLSKDVCKRVIKLFGEYKGRRPK